MKKKWIVVSTRRIETAPKQKATQHGICIKDIDFLTFNYSTDFLLRQQIIENTAPFVFTSQNAIIALQHLLKEDVTTIKTRDCYAIEGTTSQLAAKNNFVLKATALCAVDLAKTIIKNGETKVLHCTTKWRRKELQHTLTQAGIEMDICEIYTKEKTCVEVTPFDGVMFYSPSQFDAFTSCNELLPEVPIFCIGNTTANHAKKAQHKNIIVAKQTNVEAMLASVYNYFN